MEDEDLYADLPQFDHKANLEKLQDSNKDLQEQVSGLKEIVENLTKENATLKANCTHLGRNISSLIKTARTEIKRKDARIAELNKENALFKTRLRVPRNRHLELRQVRQQQQKCESVKEDRNARNQDVRTKGERDGSQQVEQRWRSEESSQGKRFGEPSGERGNSNRMDGGGLNRYKVGNSTQGSDVDITPQDKTCKEQKSKSSNLNFCSQNSKQNPDPSRIKNAPRVPKFNLPTLYSKRMYNKIYNIEPTKTESNNSNENSTEKSTASKEQTEVEKSNINSKDHVSDKLIPDIIASTEPTVIAIPAPTPIIITEPVVITTTKPTVTTTAEQTAVTTSDIPIITNAEPSDITTSKPTVTKTPEPTVITATGPADIITTEPTIIVTTASSTITQSKIPNVTVSSIMASLGVKTMDENNKLNLPKSDIKIFDTIAFNSGHSNNILSDSTILTSKTKDTSTEYPTKNEPIACIKIPINRQEKDELSPSTIVADSVQNVKLTDQRKEFISLEDELHLSSDSRIDSTNANFVDIQVNIQRNVSEIPVAELKTILSNLNKYNDSKKVVETHSSLENHTQNQIIEKSVQPVHESRSEANSTKTFPNHEPGHNSENVCSTTLGLRLTNRQTKTIVKPISAQCCETYKKIIENDNLLRNKSESLHPVSKSPPHSEDKENEKQDIVEALFGSPLKWTENSGDEVPPKLCPPPSAFEDSCSAQIENAKFKMLNNAESVSSTKTVKEIIVSKNDKDMSTMTIESRISVQKIKEIPRRPFEQINNEKNEKSNFSSYLENTTEACDVPSFTLTTVSGSVKSMRTSPIASKYHDSILGQFDDTTQLISALAKEHSKVSPINTPIKDSKTQTPEKKLTANISTTNQIQKIATPLKNYFTKKTILSSSIIKVPEKKTILLEEPINILCPRRKAKISPKSTLKNEHLDKDKNIEVKDRNIASDQNISPQQSNKSSCLKELNVNHEIINNNQKFVGRFPLEKIVSSSEKHDSTISIKHDNCNDTKRLSLSDKNAGTGPGQPQEDYKSNKLRRIATSEKGDDRDSKRHFSLLENHRDGNVKQLSSEKYNGNDSRRRFFHEEQRNHSTKRLLSPEYHDRDLKSPLSAEKYNDRDLKRPRSLEKYHDKVSKRPSPLEKHDDTKRRSSHEKYKESSSKRTPSSEKYDDPSRKQRSSEKYIDNSSRRLSSEKFCDRISVRRYKDSSSYRRNEPYKQYYDERGRKKVPFTTISTKTTANFSSPPPRKVYSPCTESKSDKSHSYSTAAFKRPLSYERIRRSNCLFRETSVERRVLKDARHRIRKTPIRIIKRKDPSAHLEEMDIPHNSGRIVSTSRKTTDTKCEMIASPKEDNSPKPTHIVRSTNKIDWSASTTQVVSTQPIENLPRPKTESLMKWVLQPIDLSPIQSPSSSREIIRNNLEKTTSPSISRKNTTPSKAGGQEITPQKSIVIISRRRPVKFGVSEISAPICQKPKEP